MKVHNVDKLNKLIFLRKKGAYVKAIYLRREGFTYNEICAQLPVAKSTISRWCSGIVLTDSQKERIRQKKINTTLIQSKIQQSLKTKIAASVWARERINSIKFNDDILTVVGTALYWAEGTKSGDENSVVFTNTDPNIIKIMMVFLLNILGVSSSKIRVKVRIGNLGNVEEAEAYWSNVTCIEKEHFQRPERIMLPIASKSLIKYPFGICRISVYDTSAFRRIMALIKELSVKLSPL